MSSVSMAGKLYVYPGIRCLDKLVGLMIYQENGLCRIGAEDEFRYRSAGSTSSFGKSIVGSANQGIGTQDMYGTVVQHREPAALEKTNGLFGRNTTAYIMIAKTDIDPVRRMQTRKHRLNFVGVVQPRQAGIQQIASY